MRIEVLTKVPRPGAVKTRLIPRLGARAAARLHRAMVEDVAELARSTGVPVRFWVAGPPDPAWRATLPGEVREQPPGDLGDRLAAALAEAPALALGTDSPTLPPELLDEGLRALARPGPAVVLGPALDGGCWAIGWTEARPKILRGVPWSTPGVHAALRAAALRAGFEVRELPAWRDVDLPEDLDHLVAELDRLPPDRAPATRRALEDAPCPR